MTVYGAIVLAIHRKISAFVAEVKKLVNEAKQIEQGIIAKCEAEVERVISAAEAEKTKLRDELVSSITKL